MGLLPRRRLSRSASIFVLVVVDLPCFSSMHSPPLKDATDFLVRGLDEIEPAFGLFEGKMYAGLLPMDNGYRRGEIMFWLFAPDQPIISDSLTIWFNGGPGCSAFGPGILVENSPATVELLPAGACCMAENETLKYNKYAWTNTTAMLYIEQPVGTGFSTGPEPRNETEVAADMYAFLQNFYAVFSDYASHQLYIFGESYAGMYVPSVARNIYLENEKLSRQSGRSRTSSRTAIDTIPIPLAGIALGNGWIDARVQGPAVIDYAYWHGMLDQYTRENLHAEYEHCMKIYDSTSHSAASDDGEANDGEPEPFHKFNVPDECGVMEATLQAAGVGVWSERMAGPNTYDVTTWDPYVILQNGGIDTTTDYFFNNPRVKDALHAPKHIEWRGCVPGSGRRRRLEQLQRHKHRQLYLTQDQPISTVPYIAELLDDAKIRVLIYNGDRDLSTNAQGSEMALNSMDWSGVEQWTKAPRGLWVVGNQSAGYSKRHLGLEFVVVYNSGHLVPYNQPVHALDLVTRFLQNKSFADHALPSFDFGYPATDKAGDQKVPSAEEYLSLIASPAEEYPLLIALAALCCFAAGFAASTHYWRNRLYERVSSAPSTPDAYSLH